MGRGGGTGSPISFACAMCRRNRDHTADADPAWNKRGSADRVRLTGRERPTRSRLKSYGRQTDTSREYTCLDCGHTGWSTHIGLYRYGLPPKT